MSALLARSNGETGDQRRLANHEGMVMSNGRAAAARTIQSRRGNDVRRDGRTLPREKFQTADVAKGQAAVLQGVFGRLKSPAKELSRVTGRSERACRNHLAGVNNMSLPDFFDACHDIPELREWGLTMMGLAATHDPRFKEEYTRGVQEIRLKFDFDGARLVPKVRQ